MGADDAGMGITSSPSKYLLGREHLLPLAPHSPATETGFFGLLVFSPMVGNRANLLFASHMGNQMDGEEGVG